MKLKRRADLYLSALAREPSKEELVTLLAHIEKQKANVKGAYEDILWALLQWQGIRVQSLSLAVARVEPHALWPPDETRFCEPRLNERCVTRSL